MINKKTVEIPAQPATEATTKVVDDGVTCDVCKTRRTSPYDHSTWGDPFTHLSVNVTRVEHETGYSYRDCANKKTRKIDICPDCFEKVLVPFLVGLGAEFREEEFDW